MMYQPFRFVAIASLWLAASLLHGNAEQEKETTLKSLELKYGVAMEKADRLLKELGEKYLEALSSLQDKFRNSGELEQVLAIRAEIKRFTKTRESPDELSELAELAQLQKIFQKQEGKTQQEAAKLVHTSKATYRKALAAAVKKLTAQGEIEEAVKAQNEIAKLGILSEQLGTWDRGMVLHMRFNHSEAGGLLPDTSGQDNHGNLKGDATLAPPEGKRSRFLRLDGKGDYVECDHSESLSLTNAATISLWIRPQELRDLRGLVCKYISSNSYTLRISNKGKKTINFGDYGFDNRSKQSPPIGKWTHVVVTLADTKMRFYFNGQLDSEGNEQKKRGLVQNTNPLRIGSDYNGRYFKGDIDEVRMYRRALSESEIAELYRIEKD